MNTFRDSINPVHYIILTLIIMLSTLWRQDGAGRSVTTQIIQSFLHSPQPGYQGRYMCACASESVGFPPFAHAELPLSKWLAGSQIWTCFQTTACKVLLPHTAYLRMSLTLHRWPSSAVIVQARLLLRNKKPLLLDFWSTRQDFDIWFL